MIITNETAYRDLNSSSYWHERTFARMKEYSLEEIAEIIESGTLEQQQRLSRYYFDNDGYYKHLVLHYATLLKYMGILIPNPSAGKSLSTSHISKRYFNAMDYVENMHLPVWLVNCATSALIDGCYYGVRVDSDKNTFAVLDLPARYCRSCFKDISGNDLIEFNLSYFDTFVVPESRDIALKAFPKVIAKAYRKWAKGGLSSSWFMIPSDIGVCLPLFNGRPFFLAVIPAIIDYNDAIANQREKDAEDIKKIIVQQIPHLSDGRLLFEPDEAAEIHAGTVSMLKGNKNLSVLTSYADVDSVTSNSSNENVDDVLNREEQNIYAQGGVSGEIFASTGSGTLAVSLQNDLACMMTFANKAAVFISNVLNEKFSNSNISFKYLMMSVSYFNESDFIDDAFKLVASGYSAIVPALAFGMSQKDLTDIKDLENQVLKLGEKLKPLSTAYTQSGKAGASSSQDSNPGEGGRPTLKGTEKTEKTIENIESENNTGGGS